MNSPDAPFTMDRSLNVNGNKFYIGDNSDSTLFQIDGTNDRVGIGTTTPGRKLTVNGEVEIIDLITTNATFAVGADGNGVLSEITIGSGLDLTAGVLTATGGGGGGSTDLSYTGTDSPITLNSSTGTDVTFTEGGIVDITASGTNMTISATEVDGSVTNELQTITNTSNATTHTVTLSNTGGSVQLVEGTNITLTTTGTGADGIVTIAAATEVDGSITNEGILGVGAGSGSTATITTNTSTGNAVTISGAGILAVTETTSANGGTITLTATEVDGSITNEGSLTVGAGAGNTSLINSNTSGSTAVTITAAGILTTAEAGNVITLTATEVDGSLSNEGTLGVGAGGASSSTITTNTSGGNAVTINVAGINTISEVTNANGGSITITATEVDGSITNEGSLTVGAGAGNTSLIQSNTSGSTAVTITAAGILTTAEAGNVITLTATEVDGSTTNELQTIANTSDATSHTVTLSNTGGSVKLAEGANITLTTTGTGADGIVTIASSGSADGNGIYSGSGTVPTLTTATVTNQFSFYRATDDGGGLVPVRIQVDAGNEPDFISFRNGSDSLRIKKGDQEFEITANKTVSIISTDNIALVADSIQIQSVPNAVENERTILMLNAGGNTIAKSEGLDPDIINQNGATSGQVLKWNGTKWAPAADDSGGGGGDVLNGGNSFGADFVVGSNDNFAVSLEQNNTRFMITNTAKNTTFLNTVAATAATTDRITLNTNSTGVAANGFGSAILFTGESSTTEDVEMARITVDWKTATHASREAEFGFQLGNNAGALSEVLKLDVADGNGRGQLTLGSSTPLSFTTSNMTAQDNFVIGTQSNTMTFNRTVAATSTATAFTTQATSSGTAANGFGVRYAANAETSTGAQQDLGYQDFVWTDVTNGTRTSDYILQTTNSGTTAEAFRVYGNKRAMVGGGTNEASAAFQVNSTTRGLLGPKGTNAEMLAIATPVEGLEFWNTTIKGKCVYNGTDWDRLSCAQTPTVTVGAGAGTGASASVTGNDLEGVISITAGTSPTANANVVTLDFHTDYDQAPRAVLITAANEPAATIMYTSGGTRVWFAPSADLTAADFKIKSGTGGNSPVNGTTYLIHYKVGQ
jgi:hypothetical protein